ncbi:hypothetical protein C8R47DRAFT_372811 [Mycena vitilis]|nr:hypothetical protein C8R47DRAFT_372811 [Mycena vitilis]
MKRLAHENPTTSEEYDALLVARFAEISIASPSERTTRILHYPGVHFDILTLARENDLLAFLPCAYFRIAKDSLEIIFQEVQRPDGTSSVLSFVNRTICSLGHEKLLRAQWEPGNTLVWMLSWEPSTNCVRRTKCQRFRDSFIASILVSPRAYAFIYVPSAEQGLCSACAKPAGAAMRAGRAKMWEALPSIFDLPPWNELEHLDES